MGRPSQRDRIERIPETGCWIWTGATNRNGYGICGDGLVHRWMYRQRFGEIEAGKYVLHKCHVRSCCNPDHLYVGTQQDNVNDAITRGTYRPFMGQPSGESHAMSKLTADDVVMIKVRKRRGEPAKSLATEFGISIGQVSKIVRGDRWNKVDLIGPAIRLNVLSELIGDTPYQLNDTK